MYEHVMAGIARDLGEPSAQMSDGQPHILLITGLRHMKQNIVWHWGQLMWWQPCPRKWVIGALHPGHGFEQADMAILLAASSW